MLRTSLSSLALAATLATVPLAAPLAMVVGPPVAAPVAGDDPLSLVEAGAPDAGELALAAKATADHGHRPEAWSGLFDGVEALLKGGHWPDERTAAEAEIAVLLLGQLSHQLDAWREVSARLQGWRTWPRAGGAPDGGPGPRAGDSVPHRVALHVDRLLARALQGVGRYDEARGVIDGLG